MRRFVIVIILVTAGCGAGAPTAMVACPPQGCAALDPPTPMQRALLDHAAFDLQCPPAQLRVRDVDDVTASVSGCGRMARYAWIASRYRARWLLDSPILATAGR